MAQWKCRIGGRELGPVDDSQLLEMAQRGQISRQDSVWNPAASRWDPAWRLNGLFPADAAPGLAANSSPTELVPRDPGPFYPIGTGFNMSSDSMNLWKGPVVASPNAIYLVKATCLSVAAAGGLYGGVGAILGAALAPAQKDVRTCDVGALPDTVRQAIDPKGKYARSSVILLPKGAIHRMQVPRFWHVMAAECGEDRFRIYSNLFRINSVAHFLRTTGWRLNQEVEVVAEANYGEGFGRTEADADSGPSLAMRVLYLLLAFAILACIAYVRRNW